MDWNDTGYAYLIEVSVVSQTNVDEVLGPLSGVILNGASITENYNSDSRIQAKVSTIMPDGESDGYVANARLRILVTIPSREWSEELVTGYVTNINEKSERGYTRRDYTIEGTLWGLLNHKIKEQISIAEDASMVETWKTLVSTLTKMQYSTVNAGDRINPKLVVYEVGTNLSTVLFEITEGSSRMDTSGHGVITLEKYIAPSKRTPDRVIDFNDSRTLAISPLEKTSKEWDAPGRAIVTSTVSTTNAAGETTQEVISGYYDAPSSHHTSISVRGWLNARSDAYNGTSSETPSQEELDSQAKKNWENAQDKGKTWSASSIFADYHIGQVATLIAPSIGSAGVKVLIEGVQTNLESFTQDLTMKEV